jgi:hypothetical protein
MDRLGLNKGLNVGQEGFKLVAAMPLASGRRLYFMVHRLSQ